MPLPRFRAFYRDAWRSDAKTLAMLAAIVTLVLVGFAIFASDYELATRTFHRGFMLLATVAVTVVVAPGIAANGPWHALAQRMPGALLPAIAARVAFLLTTLVLAACLGLGVAEAARLTVSIPEHVVVETRPYFTMPLGAFAMNAAVALWIMATGSWMRSPLLAIPAAGLTVCVLAVPAVLSFVIVPVGHEGLELGKVLSVAWILLAPVVALLWSGLRPRRFVDAGFRPAIVGLTVLLVVAMPMYGVSVQRVSAMYFPEPDDPNLQSFGYMVDAEGKTAWMTAHVPFSALPSWHREWLPPVAHAFRIDLETGEHERVDALSSWVGCPGPNGIASWFDVSGPKSILTRSTSSWSGEDTTHEFIDATTGNRLGAAAWPVASDELKRRIVDQRRATSPFRSFDGRRMWVFDHELFIDSPVGANPVSLGRAGKDYSFVHHAYFSPTQPMISRRHGGSVIVGWDSVDQPRVEQEDWSKGNRLLPGDPPHLMGLRVAPGGQGPDFLTVANFDGDIVSEWPWRPQTRIPEVILDDGRIVVPSAANDVGHAHILDVHSGETTPIRISGEARGRRVATLRWARLMGGPLRSPSGRQTVSVVFEPDPDGTVHHRLGLLDPTTGAIALCGVESESKPRDRGVPIHFVSEEEAIVSFGPRSLWRVRFDGGEPVKLWPRN